MTNEKASPFCVTKNLAAPYLSLESQKPEVEFLYLSYLLLVLQMAECRCYPYQQQCCPTTDNKRKEKKIVKVRIEKD